MRLLRHHQLWYAVASLTIWAVVASVASIPLPPLALSILSISSGIFTGPTLTFNFKYNKYEITKLNEKLKSDSSQT